MAEFSFDIRSEGATLPTSGSGWSTKVRRVAWGSNPEKWDIRPWSPDDSKCGKGVTLTDAEVKALRDYLNTLEFPEDGDKQCM